MFLLFIYLRNKALSSPCCSLTCAQCAREAQACSGGAQSSCLLKLPLSLFFCSEWLIFFRTLFPPFYLFIWSEFLAITYFEWAWPARVSTTFPNTLTSLSVSRYSRKQQTQYFTIRYTHLLLVIGCARCPHFTTLHIY